MCIQCNSKNMDYQFSVVEIQTLHIRDIGGERYVQAMGEQQEHSICSSCAKQYLAKINHPMPQFFKKCIPSGLVIILGILTLFFMKTDIIFMQLLGPIAILFGVMNISYSYRELSRQKRNFSSFSPEEALEKSAWFLLLQQLPKKNGENDLTYIPINSKTRAMDIKEFVRTYDLLPAIASKVKESIK